MFQFCRRQADNYREQLGERFTSLICFSGDNEIVSICYARETDPTTPVASHQSCIAYQNRFSSIVHASHTRLRGNSNSPLDLILGNQQDQTDHSCISLATLNTLFTRMEPGFSGWG
jgi:hypothetical protein